jgi:erythromycin esterase
LAFFIGPSSAQTQNGVRPTIERRYEQMGLALDRKDTAAYLTFFAPGAAVVDTYGFAKPAAETALTFESVLAQQSKGTYRYTIKDAAGSANEAVMTATLEWSGDMTINGAASPMRIENTERDTWVGTGGEWRISRSEEIRSRLWIGDMLVVDRLADIPPPPAERAALLADIRGRAIPIKSVQAGSGFEDLDAVGAMIGDARIVALGEGTHGTAEFFKMKYRLFEYLVEKKGFTVFGIEANWATARIVDRYIKTGDGDVDKATRALQEPWATQEVRDMIGWMRVYNARRGDRVPVSFFGFDMQSPGDAVKCVIDLVARLGPSDQAEVARLYEDTAGFWQVSNEEIARLRAQALRVAELLDTKRDELAKVLNPAERLELSRCARHINQAYELRAMGTPPMLRDAMMAENAQRLIAESYPQQKVVLWAHNGHVETWRTGAEIAMGGRLREAFGHQMFVVGFATDRGQVRARRLKDGGELNPGRWVSLPLNPSVPYSADALFAATGLPRFALDLRHPPADNDLARWLSRNHLIRDVGWGYDPDNVSFGYEAPIDLATSFNALIFIAETNAAKSLSDSGDPPR